MSAENCSMAERAMQKITDHIDVYERDREELNNKIGGIFTRLDNMSNRWLALSASIIMILLGITSWLLIKLLQIKGFVP